MTLPTPAEFMADAGLGGGTKSQTGVDPFGAPREIQVPGVSKEFKRLLVDYCAQSGAESLDAVDWRGLGKRLGTPSEFIAQAAQVVDAAIGIERGGIWAEVINERIKLATAAGVFRNASWQRLESKALDKLLDLAERNKIVDPGELLAIATTAKKMNDGIGGGAGGGNHTSITINGVGAEPMNENGLPPAGAKMTIDLSPRLAEALQKRSQPVAEHGARVIDGEMISAKDLRNVLESKAASNEGDEA